MRNVPGNAPRLLLHQRAVGVRVHERFPIGDVFHFDQPGGKRVLIDLLRRAFQYAVNRDLVAQNPFENAILPKTDILKKGVREIDY